MQAEIGHLSQELRFQIKQHNEIKHLNDQKALDLHKYTTESTHLHQKVKSMEDDRELLLGKISELEARNQYYQQEMSKKIWLDAMSFQEKASTTLRL